MINTSNACKAPPVAIGCNLAQLAGAGDTAVVNTAFTTVQRALASNSEAHESSACVSRRRIPRILHHVFMSGEAAYLQDCENFWSRQTAFPRKSCLMFHPTWQHMFW